jgi:glycosyltransferase involved in cell wall biosynthesis
MFGRWAAARIEKESWDAVVLWSGVAEETLQALSGGPVLRLVHRCSAHIATQARLLKEEEVRTGAPQDRPTAWMMAREQREYQQADAVVVLSTFSYNTFISEGYRPEKLYIVLSGADINDFRPDPQVIEDRCARILSGEPIRILNVGNFSFQKGVWDMAEIIRGLGRERYVFRFVGSVASEASALASDLEPLATFIPKQPQSKLPTQYAWGDIFILPTIQDGFQTVLGQAAASGLPILTTANGAGLDIVREGESGWVLPIRNPESFIERLRWCDSHREELASMACRIYHNFKPRDWADVAADFESICLSGTRAESQTAVK